MLMKALTVSALVTRAHAVAPGQTVLAHAAAGGVGQLLCSWCWDLGATVIGTVGSRDKAAIAERTGAHHASSIGRRISSEDFVTRVRAQTGRQGIAAAYDAVGKDTFQGSLDSLDFEGTLVNYGQASGPVAPVAPSELATRSLTLVRPIVFHYIRTDEKPARLSKTVFKAFRDGIIPVS